MLLISMMSVWVSGPSSRLSGRMRRRVEGHPPSTRCQYSGWEVYWSQATTLHLLYSQSGQENVRGQEGKFILIHVDPPLFKNVRSISPDMGASTGQSSAARMA